MITWVHYFYVKTDFQICISVPLKLKNNFEKVNLNNSNPLVHFKSYSLTNSVVKFTNLRQYIDLSFQTTTFQNTCQLLLLIFEE